MSTANTLHDPEMSLREEADLSGLAEAAFTGFKAAKTITPKEYSDYLLTYEAYPIWTCALIAAVSCGVVSKQEIT